MRIIISVIAAFTLAATACTEPAQEPEFGAPDEAVARLAQTGELGSLPSPDVLDEQTAASAQYVGRYIKLAFGWQLSQLEQIQCLKLDMTSETIRIGDCTYTIRNQGCATSWSESVGQYVCSCDVYVTGASGEGC